MQQIVTGGNMKCTGKSIMGAWVLGLAVAGVAYGADAAASAPNPAAAGSSAHPARAQLYEDLRGKLTPEGFELVPGLLRAGLLVEVEAAYKKQGDTKSSDLKLSTFLQCPSRRVSARHCGGRRSVAQPVFRRVDRYARRVYCHGRICHVRLG